MDKTPQNIGEFRELQKMQGERKAQADLLYSMHEISRLIVTYFDRAIAAHKITHSQWWAIMHIFRNEGLIQTDLANHLRMGRSAAGKILERLEKKGWIERRPDPSDERVRRVFLRDNALQLLLPMSKEGTRQFELFLQGFSQAEIETLLGGIQRIKENAVLNMDGENPAAQTDKPRAD